MVTDFTPHSAVVRDCQSYRETCEQPPYAVVKAASGARLTIDEIENLDPAISLAVSEWRSKILAKARRSDSPSKPNSGQSKPGQTTYAIKAEIAKLDEDRRLVYLWASVSSTDNGETLLIDKQGDVITEAELESAAVDHMLFSDLDGDVNHDGIPVTKLVGSLVFTAELKKALGIAEAMPTVGWLVCYKVLSDEAWAKVKSGELAMGSIEAWAERVPV